MIPSTSRHDLRDPQDIRILVDTFYKKVQADPLLAPIFNDVARIDWAHHLPVMNQFWEKLLFRTGGYAGSPFPKHVILPLQTAHFERWLALFRQTVDELFDGAKALDAKGWAESIAHTFQQRMGLPVKWPGQAS